MQNIDQTDESKTLKQEAKEIGMSEPALKNVLDNILHEAEEKKQREKIRNFRKYWDIPLRSTELSIKIEGMVKRGGVKLSQLFLVFHHKDEGEINFTIPDKIIRELKENLKTPELDLSSHIDTHKIRIFYAYWFPSNLILDSRKYNYPNISKSSVRFKTEIAGKPGLIL